MALKSKLINIRQDLDLTTKITEQTYLQAKKIVQLYEQQQKIPNKKVVQLYVVYWVTAAGVMYFDIDAQTTPDINRAKTYSNEQEANTFAKKKLGGWALVKPLEQ